MAYATAKPRVVTTPTSLPPRSYASGIIVFAGMGQDRTGRERQDERDGGGRRVLEQPIAAMEARPETTAIPIHIPRIHDFFQPLLSRPVVDEIGSGRLE